MAKSSKSVDVEVAFDSTKATAQLKRAFDKVINNPTLKSEIGAEMVKTVVAKARLQKPLNNTGTFPKLAPLTKAQREYLARFNNTGKNFAPEKANVTLTGQLLESLTFDISKKGLIRLWFGGERRGYFTGPKGRQKLNDANDTNSKVAALLAEKKFIIFTKRGIESDTRLMKRINSKVKKYLRRALTVYNNSNDDN